MRLTAASFLDHARRQIVSGVVLAAVFSSAGAADAATDATRVLSDPTYLPAARQFVGVTEYFNSKSTGDIDDYIGAKQYSFKSRFQSRYQMLAYGITDRLSVGVSSSYATVDTDFSYTNGMSKSTGDSGVNLGVGATYRLLDQQKSPVSLDISGVVRTGGAPLGASVAVGYKSTNFTIKGLVGANQFNGGGYTAQPQEVPAWVDASRRYFVAVQTQTRFTDSFSLNLSMSYAMSMSSVDAIKSGIPYTIDFADTIGAGISLNYHFIANKLVGRLGYHYSMDGKKYDRYVNPTLNTTMDKHRESSFVTGLLYAF